MALRETERQTEREAGGEVNSRGKRSWVHKDLSRVLKVNRDERREMEDWRGCSCRELLVGKREEWVIVLTGALQKRQACSNLLSAHTMQLWGCCKKTHLKMDLNHHSPWVINAKWKAIIFFLQERVFTLQRLIYAIMHLRSLATKQQALGKTLGVIISLSPQHSYQLFLCWLTLMRIYQVHTLESENVGLFCCICISDICWYWLKFNYPSNKPLSQN